MNPVARERTVMSVIDYIHANPIRRGFVERARQWKWSSARWYESEGQDIDPDLPLLRRLPPEFFVRDSLTRLKSDE